ncbi:TonB family protein [Biformimicrobium ophioploci]|uniref:TonB C-terminal domain-containing protein n=1 Tax=Biformimicrobium ophioploci TaxID=3036711 RepID=A0ABQ6LYM1_9GAMM|nr:TonB family protein [Microbulbifer sp. NKW57]GMG87151.1 hypothetical protein MNKW57_14720 [Microbulbifer sp. NKW57]
MKTKIFVSTMLWVFGGLFTMGALAQPLMNGLALNQEFNKDSYIAAFYSETLTSDRNAALSERSARRLEVRVVEERLSARRLRSQWIEGIAINNGSDVLTAQSDNMVSFANMFRGRLYAGDNLAVEYKPNAPVVITLNGKELGQVNDPAFFNVLLRAWIGPVPPSSDFREGLLSSGNVDSGLALTFESLQPSAERVAATRGASRTVAAAPAPEPQEQSQPASAAPMETVPAALPMRPSLASVDTSDLKVEAPAIEKAPAPEKPKPKPVQTAKAKPKPAPVEDDELDEDDEVITADMLLARQIYQSSLFRHARKGLRYPARAQQRGHEGSVRIAVVINREGEIQDIATVQESRYGTLNRAAEEAIKRAAPFPEIPTQLKDETFSFTMPITFRMPK